MVLSLAGFVARGLGAFSGAAWVHGRLARTLPHVVDTVLLLSALAMAWMLRLTPGSRHGSPPRSPGCCCTSAWGCWRCGRGGRWRWRIGAWVAALLCFGWIVSVALSKNPLGALRGLAA